VTSIRGNSLAGLISIESPMGKALLGHKEGDRVFIPAGAGGYYVVIKKIDKTTDDSEDSIRKF
jgi:transcription elongation factor GreA